MTTSEAPEAHRYASEIIRLHEKLRFQRLPDAIDGDPIVSFADPAGLTTLSVTESQLPLRYLRALLGFRLAKFLENGFMDPELALRHALYHEPVERRAGQETLHVVTMDSAGQIVGYAALYGAQDASPEPLDSPRRRPFPAEVAHSVDLLSRFAAPGLDSHHVYETKRMVRDPSMTSSSCGGRVPWHLILGLGITLLTREAGAVLGDARQGGALRHLRAVGFSPVVIDGTRPTLPRTELMWPSYRNPVVAKPFAALVPPRFGRVLQVIHDVLESEPEPRWQRTLLNELTEARRD